MVFDVLRATSTLLLHSPRAGLSGTGRRNSRGARPTAEDPEVLLAGERQGLRIDGSQTGGVEFDLGNSP